MSKTAAVKQSTPWHEQERVHVLDLLNSTGQGVTQEEADARLMLHGSNVIPAAPPKPWWFILGRQFRSPLIYILALAAVISFFIQEWTDGGFIVAVLVLNAIIGGIQEWKAERSSRALQKLLRIRASVLRNGELCEIDADQVIPGDVVWLESGNRIPADLRLLSSHGFKVDESLLTGESMAVTKDAEVLHSRQTPLADRLNMAFAGSIVTHGRAKGVVVATGAATHVGQLAGDVIETTGGVPPLLIRLAKFTRMIGIAVVIASILVAVFGVFLQGHELSTMFLFAVALAVSAIPEGLPVAITVALAAASHRMSRRGVIVRQLGAVEGLGSCTFIATDKTGTLTCNELTVQEIRLPIGSHYRVVGSGFAPKGEVLANERRVDPADHPELMLLTRACVLCNEADLHRSNDQWKWRGDPTDVALLTLGLKLGVSREALSDTRRQVDEIPFEPEHQYAATFHEVGDEVWAFVKGAPERVLAMCNGADGQVFSERVRDDAKQMAERGIRVLAVAYGPVNEHVEDNKSQTFTIPQPLTFLGLVGMVDPLRPGVGESIQACHKAGLKVCMVTGDHPVTALAIGQQLGLVDSDAEVLTGENLEDRSEEEMDRLVKRVRIFARVPPHTKLLIVQAAQRLGHFVAVTGDGVNDAPALHCANVGVAMGQSGTDVAREAADLVISDDNFATIVAGVEEGRIAYDNVRKVIYLVTSTGAAEVVLVLTAIALGLPLPLLPVQLLWLNLVTNGIQDVALAFEPGEDGVLDRPPRPAREPIFNRLMIERTLVAAVVMGGVGIITFACLLNAGWSVPAAQNGTLLLWVLFENIHIGNCRSETQSALRLSPWKSPLLLVGATSAFLLHVIAMYTPLGQQILKTEAINLEQWGVYFVLALTIFMAMELHKWSWAIRQRRRRQPT